MAGACFWSQISRNFGPKSSKASPKKFAAGLGRQPWRRLASGSIPASGAPCSLARQHYAGWLCRWLAMAGWDCGWLAMFAAREAHFLHSTRLTRHVPGLPTGDVAGYVAG